MAEQPAFDILEHTADIGVRARGASFEQLLSNLALGVECIALDCDRVDPRIAYPIDVTGEDAGSLAVNFLNEVIYYLDARHVVFARFQLEYSGHDTVRGQAFGEPRDPELHPSRLVVKAATYHQLRVERDNGGWVGEVYLDI